MVMVFMGEVKGVEMVERVGTDGVVVMGVREKWWLWLEMAIKAVKVVEIMVMLVGVMGKCGKWR